MTIIQSISRLNLTKNLCKRHLRFSSNADYVRLTNVCIIIIIHYLTEFTDGEVTFFSALILLTGQQKGHLLQLIIV